MTNTFHHVHFLWVYIQFTSLSALEWIVRTCESAFFLLHSFMGSGSSKQFLCLSREAVGETIWHDKTTYCSSRNSNVSLVTKMRKNKKKMPVFVRSTCWRFFSLNHINFFYFTHMRCILFVESSFHESPWWVSYIIKNDFLAIPLPNYNDEDEKRQEITNVQKSYKERVRTGMVLMRAEWDYVIKIISSSFLIFFLLPLIRKHFIMIWWDDDGW